jgi:hypothetical protein
MDMRTSIFHNRDAVESAVKQANSIREAIELLGLRAAGGNYKSLHAACERFDLSVPYTTGESQTESARTKNRRADDEVFVKNSDYHNRTQIKMRMFKLGVPNVCSECGQGPEWNGRPLTLTLDHINGVWNDNRLENLRILCGHCHSQTGTFCGGNRQ